MGLNVQTCIDAVIDMLSFVVGQKVDARSNTKLVLPLVGTFTSALSDDWLDELKFRLFFWLTLGVS